MKQKPVCRKYIEYECTHWEQYDTFLGNIDFTLNVMLLKGLFQQFCNRLRTNRKFISNANVIMNALLT